MPKPRLTPEDWITAGFHALASDGPEALKAEKLARDLGATKGSFYWHFKDINDFRSRMLEHWRSRAYDDITRAVNNAGSATERLFRLGELATTEDASHGGAATEPAIRAWGLINHTVADVIAELDRDRQTYLASILADLGLTNPDFVRIIYGAYIGMGTLSATDVADNTEAMSTLMAALLALRDA